MVSENLAAYEEGGGSATGPYATHAFTFDHVYDQHCDQKKVYETTAKAVVESSLKGYNATIFAVRCWGVAGFFFLILFALAARMSFSMDKPARARHIRWKGLTATRCDLGTAHQ